MSWEDRNGTHILRLNSAYTVRVFAGDVGYDIEIEGGGDTITIENASETILEAKRAAMRAVIALANTTISLAEGELINLDKEASCPNVKPTP